ncbi:MAG: hypothetical protein WCC48_15365 [Anaeromyxobacteraceae bacterium]
MEGVGTSVYVAVFAYIAIVVVLFASMEPRRAVLTSVLAGLLFLPVFDRLVQFGIVHTKVQLIEFSVFTASLLVHYDLWRRLRLSAWDLPVAILCAAPFVASITNGLGAYDGASAVFEASFTWGAAYLLGRVYFGTVVSLRHLARAVVAGAVVYAPFCWWEIRMSPQLHRLLYGYHQHSFIQQVRDSGFRPMVFMQHGLMVATFMATGTLVAYWLWRSRDRLPFFGIPSGWVVTLLGVTTVLCKSLAAVGLLLAGVLLLEASRRLRSSALVFLMLGIAPLYCGARINGWSAGAVVDLAYELVSPERAASLQVRVDNEDVLVEKGMKRPWFGWGRWGGSRVYDEEGKDTSITDGLWVVVLGVNGLVGLANLGATLLLPVVAILLAYRRRLWADARLASGGALAVALALWVVDDVLNAMVTPVFPMVAGALVAFATSGWRTAIRSPRLAPAAGTLAVELRRGYP